MENKKRKKIKVKTGRSLYSREKLLQAVEEAKQGKSIAELSRMYQVPESTIRTRKMGKCADKKPGPATVLTAEEEADLVKWAFYCCKLGFPITKFQLIDSVQMICNHKNVKTVFTDNKPGRSWYDGFLQRHPNLSQRMSENVTISRATVSEENLRCWFTEIEDYLSKENLLDIGPRQIFNADETGVPLNPKPPRVIAPKGCKNVYNIVSNNEKENVTVLIVGNANGELAPPLVLFTGKSLPQNISEVAPADYGFGFSDNGWMTAKNFYEYVANVFEPWLQKNAVPRPVILYIDGHSSHITLPLSKFCDEKQIVLIALYPNSTHILQPLDVSFFRTFKATWQKTWKDFCNLAATIVIKKFQFAPVLKRTLDNMNVKEILQIGFKTCGLYPLNVDAVDFTKVFQKTQSPGICQSDNDSGNQSKLSVADEELLQFLEKKLDPNLLGLFRSHNENTKWTGRIEDTSLFEFWLKLKTSPVVVNMETLEYTSSNHAEELDDLPFASTSTCSYANLDAGNVQNMDIQQDFQLKDQNDQNGITIEWALDDTDIEMTDEVQSVFVFQDAEKISPNQFETQFSNTQALVITESDSEIKNLTNQTVKSAVDFEKELELILSDPNRIEIDDSKISNLTNYDATVQSNSTTPKTLQIIGDKIEQDTNFSDPESVFQFQTTPTIVSQPTSVPDVTISKSLNVANHVLRKFSAAPLTPLQDVTNNENAVHLSKSPIDIKTFLHYPKIDLTAQNKKRRNSAKKMPSVLTTPQWQKIIQEKEDLKLQKLEEAALKKKIRLENQEKNKIEKEQKRMEREEKKFKQEQIRLQKEKEKFLKQQQKIQNLEAQKLTNEGILNKKRKTVELRRKIEELQAAEAELLKEN